MRKIFGIFNKKPKIESSMIQCIFCGKIYNYPELRKQLEFKGCLFKSKTDKELIIHLYKQYGDKFLSYLDGSFSLALIDGNKLLLAIDKFGIKPFYYYHNNDDSLIFSSDIGSILSKTPKHKLSKNGLSSYLQYRFVAHPFTIFDDIYKLSPQTMLIFQNGKTKLKKYNVRKNNKSLSTGLRQNIKRYETKKTGILLSGGLDSSILTCILSNPAHAFTIKYENSPDTDETIYAAAVAKYRGMHHHIITLKNKDVLGILNKCVKALEEPLYSTVAVSTYYLSQNAKKYVDSIICGDGSDELFLGYNYIRTAMNNVGNELETYKQQISWLQNDIAYKILCNKPSEFNLINYNSGPLSEIVNFERLYRLPNYHLSRVDKLTSANSIEGKTPYLSNDVYDYVSQFKYSELLTTPAKKPLIDEFSDYLPDIILNRKKQPFTTPFVNWIDSCLQADIKKTFSNKKLCEILGLNSSELLKILEKSNKHYFDYTAIWGFYILLKWLYSYKKYIQISTVAWLN